MCSRDTKAECEAFLHDTSWRFKDSPIKGPRPNLDKREDSDEENSRKKLAPHCLSFLIPEMACGTSGTVDHRDQGIEMQEGVKEITHHEKPASTDHGRIKLEMSLNINNCYKLLLNITKLGQSQVQHI